MSTEEKQHLALEAERLLNDDTINKALDAMRIVGLENLVLVDPSKPDDIRKWQAYVAAVDAFRGQLSVFVTRGKERTQRGSVA